MTWTYWRILWCLSIGLETALCQLLTEEEVLIAITSLYSNTLLLLSTLSNILDFVIADSILFFLFFRQITTQFMLTKCETRNQSCSHARPVFRRVERDQVHLTRRPIQDLTKSLRSPTLEHAIFIEH